MFMGRIALQKVHESALQKVRRALQRVSRAAKSSSCAAIIPLPYMYCGKTCASSAKGPSVYCAALRCTPLQISAFSPGPAAMQSYLGIQTTRIMLSMLRLLTSAVILRPCVHLTSSNTNKTMTFRSAALVVQQINQQQAPRQRMRVTLSTF